MLTRLLALKDVLRKTLTYTGVHWIFPLGNILRISPPSHENVPYGRFPSPFLLIKAKIHYTSLPVANCDFLVASPQQVRHIKNKSVTRWLEQKSVVSVVSWRFPNSITTSCCGLVGRVANKSATSWQLPRPRGNMCNRFWSLGHPLLLLVCQCELRTTWNKRAEPWISAEKGGETSFGGIVRGRCMGEICPGESLSLRYTAMFRRWIRDADIAQW